MVRCAEVYDAPSIVHAARAQLSWTHLRELMAIEDPLKRRFYTEMCRLERWSTRAHLAIELARARSPALSHAPDEP